MNILSCENLTLGYEGRPVVTGLNFAVGEGQYLCIVGENGSGKTTLMRAILGLQSPMQGQIITHDGLKKEEIGYLPQQTLAQRDFPASVYEVVQSGCLNKSGRRPFYNKQQKARAREAMARLGITEFAKKCYRNLSGGQQQRVLLARALCAADRVLLLDEPASGLDPAFTEELYSLIRALNQEGMTILMISHDLRAAARDASHILHLANRQLFFGEKEAYLNTDIGRLYALLEATT